MKTAICLSALLSLEATEAFQVQPKSWPGKKSPNLPDDGMQDMAGEMAKLDTNYDFSYNISPTARHYRPMPQPMPQLAQETEPLQQERQSWLALPNGETPEIPQVIPWSKDDLIRDAAIEWEALGTNYDYSFNNSPSEIRCKETESRQALLVKQRQDAQAAAAQKAALLVKPKLGDHWEQWMSLSRHADRGETALAWPAKEETTFSQGGPDEGYALPESQQAANGDLAPSEFLNVPSAGVVQSYLSSL